MLTMRYVHRISALDSKESSLLDVVAVESKVKFIVLQESQILRKAETAIFQVVGVPSVTPREHAEDAKFRPLLCLSRISHNR